MRNNIMNAKITELLTQLRLLGMVDCIDDVLKHAEKKGLSTEDVLLELLKSEYRDKQIRCLNNRIRDARLPWEWTLDTFPFKHQPAVNKLQIMNLAKLNFIERHENVILIGKPGTGKSGLAMGLLRQALLNGYRGRFYNTQDMLNELYASLADHKTPKLLKKLYNYDVIVVDELGYLNLKPEQVNMFFKLIDMRYGKKPTIITTNLPFNAWYDVFKQKELVDALLDRFKHYCTVITINGPSLRKPNEDQQSSTKNHLAKGKTKKKV
jgi:DNA replication protein DnaC